MKNILFRDNMFHFMTLILPEDQQFRHIAHISTKPTVSKKIILE